MPLEEPVPVWTPFDCCLILIQKQKKQQTTKKKKTHKEIIKQHTPVPPSHTERQDQTRKGSGVGRRQPSRLRERPKRVVEFLGRWRFLYEVVGTTKLLRRPGLWSTAMAKASGERGRGHPKSARCSGLQAAEASRFFRATRVHLETCTRSGRRRGVEKR